MNHVRIIAVVFALALAIAFSGCVDPDSGKQKESQGDGAPSGTAHYPVSPNPQNPQKYREHVD